MKTLGYFTRKGDFSGKRIWVWGHYCGKLREVLPFPGPSYLNSLKKISTWRFWRLLNGVH
jgi:hypothetical protein